MARKPSPSPPLRVAAHAVLPLCQEHAARQGLPAAPRDLCERGRAAAQLYEERFQSFEVINNYWTTGVGVCQNAERKRCPRKALEFWLGADPDYISRASLPQETTEWVDAFRELSVGGSSLPRSRKQLRPASQASLTRRQRVKSRRRPFALTPKTTAPRAARASTRKRIARSVSSLRVRSRRLPVSRPHFPHQLDISTLSAVSHSAPSG